MHTFLSPFFYFSPWYLYIYLGIFLPGVYFSLLNIYLLNKLISMGYELVCPRQPWQSALCLGLCLGWDKGIF